MAKLTIETLVELKEFFDSQLEATLSQIGENDSERLVKNRVSGFLLVIYDKLIQIKPKLAATRDDEESRVGSVSQQNRTFTQRLPMQRHAEQIMGSHSVSGNSQHMNEPMGKSRLTVIAENSPDMTGSRKKTSKYQGMMKSSTGFQDKYRLTKSFDSNGLHSQLDFDYSETVKAEAIQNLSQEDNDPFHKQKSTFLSFKKEAQPKEQVQKKS